MAFVLDDFSTIASSSSCLVTFAGSFQQGQVLAIQYGNLFQDSISNIPANKFKIQILNFKKPGPFFDGPGF